MTNTTKTFHETYNQTVATAIIDNRYFCDAQLDADDFSPMEWDTFRKTCDTLGKAAFDYVNGKRDDTVKNLDAAIITLFRLVGIDAKNLDAYRPRLAMACVTRKRVKSEELKDAERRVKKAMAEIEYLDSVSFQLDAVTIKAIREKYPDVKHGSKDFDNAVAEIAPTISVKTPDDKKYTYERHDRERDEVTKSFRTWNAVVEKLYSEPHNCYYDLQPAFPLTGKRAGELNPAARKHVEDTLADILAERSVMTAEELLKEAAAVAAARKQSRKMKKA